MNQPHDPNATAGIPSSIPPDSLDAGLAAGFGRRAAPRSTLGDACPVLLKEAEGESAHVVKPKSDAMPPKEEIGDRYRLDGEIARGGMGAVLRGRDVDLGRDLAVKVLLEKYANRPAVARRFIEEAQIGGQLQHPGVVPVYDIGRFGDRPFFTMKLVKGLTLAAILGERTNPATDRPRLLGIALQVAQTLAYAHAKGVIHRDLKPANVMVGAFGEVQVMDWGLAKVLAEGGVADEERAGRAPQEPEDVTTIRTARSTGTAGSHGSETEAGSLLGTPAYMPPEQANGDLALVDRRADVFGLGAILCEVLTGRPPYVGRSGEEVRRKAANGDLADAATRLGACGADAEIAGLTRACLSPEAADRPKDAQDVADGLSAYLNGVQERVQAAERERAVAVVREAEQRKKRKVQLALAGAVGLLLLGGGAFGWWQTEQAGERRLADQRAAAEVARLDGERAAERAQRQLEDARRAAADAARLGRNAEAVIALLGQCEEALRADDAAKAAVALEAAKKRSAEGGAEEEAGRLGRLGADLALLHDLGAIDQFRWTWSADRFPDAAVVATRTQEALRRFGADPDAVSADDAAARVSASVVRERIVSALDRLLRQERTAGVRAVLRRVDPDPYRDAIRDSVVAGNRAKIVELGAKEEALEQPPGFAALLGDCQEIGVERRRQVLQAAVSRRPGDVGLLMQLGSSYRFDKDKVEERLRWFQAAVAAAPANYAAHINLGGDLGDTGRWDEAIACNRQAIAIDPKHPFAHVNLGNALACKGRLDEAIACYQKAIALDPKIANAHVGLGAALAGKGLLDEAIACYQKAIALDPKGVNTHLSLGIALSGHKKLDEAIAYFKKAIALDPKNANAYVGLGAILRDVKRDYDGAITCFNKAIALDPKNAQAHVGLGVALAGKGRVDEAMARFNKAIELDPKNANAHVGLGAILCDVKRDYDGAITCFRKVIELNPKRAGVHYNLGNALNGKGLLEEAMACFNKAIELDPEHAEAYCNLGHALARQGRFAESLVPLKRGHEMGMEQPGWRYPSAEWVRQAEANAALEAKLPAFLKGEFRPADNKGRLVLLLVCQARKLHHTAAGLAAAALAADPSLAADPRARLRYNAACSASLAAAGRGEDAVRLDDAAKAKLRGQALDWLKADLTAWTRRLDSGSPQTRPLVVQTLRHWQKDPDLAGVRDKAALAELAAEERGTCTQLWADVAALLTKAEKEPK